MRAVALAVRNQMADARALLATNQPDGFDCPGCAWPDQRHGSSFEFCENGAKAVAWEATAKRVDPNFFTRHSATALSGWSEHELEAAGRLTRPLRYNRDTDHYEVITYQDAFRITGEAPNALASPDQAEFYASGRTSNEAAFLWHLFVRAFGANNFPDCSNMCHEATSVGLPQSIGVGKGTVTLEGFEKADAIFCIGHSPGTNHPRRLAGLRDAAQRGASIVVANPMKEHGERGRYRQARGRTRRRDEDRVRHSRLGNGWGAALAGLFGPRPQGDPCRPQPRRCRSTRRRAAGGPSRRRYRRRVYRARSRGSADEARKTGDGAGSDGACLRPGSLPGALPFL